MNSWDCFDTLVARRYKDHYTIFDEVGQKLSIKNFRELRISAEKNSNGTFEEIYKNLPGIDPNIEIELDIEHCFPIVENIQQVKDGDVIVSDIYYPTSVVEKILKKCGLNKNVKFYVSPDGKRNGWIWKTIEGTIDKHTGDNKKTDVKSPKKFGIESVYYTGSFFNEIEENVFLKNPNLALWMRYIRLSCPYIDNHLKNLWHDQSNFNLPILTLASLELPERTIAFTYRDSIFWKSIYETLTKKSAIRFDSSRIMLNNPSKEFKNYVNFQIKDCVIADLQGTGTSLLNFFHNPPEIYFIGGKIKNHEKIKSISGLRAPAIEKHNCSPEGSLIGWDINGMIRATPEHPSDLLKAQHSAFNIAIETLPYYKINKDLHTLKYLLEKMKNNYTDLSVRWVENHN
jgi:hypothetical protein